ncbi:carbon-nitrogen hydrolase [Microdochium bolleyi]|uniref:Carbon-nitrogen hydrolase n=1 Tax=Microdochium bolleyi TaxID=196109 RepID=A0A136J1A2_9PEZI|nr:carbon-nitrogen hydrolase [Microdochium bolleyi]
MRLLLGTKFKTPFSFSPRHYCISTLAPARQNTTPPCPRTSSALLPSAPPRLPSTHRKHHQHISHRTMATSASQAPVLKKPVRLACIQLASGPDKAANLAHARAKVLEASRAPHSADIVVLPECFNSPYGCDYFPSYAETLLPSPPTPEQSPSFHALSEMAREAGVYLVGGSIPELGPSPSSSSSPPSSEGGADGKQKYYNTSLTFSPEGTLLATHRKVHLFDIDIPGGITFRESDVLSPGNKLTVIDLPEYGRIAVAICYDIRFPELATIAARGSPAAGGETAGDEPGCFALIYPGAFNLTTGPLHWKLLAQARAVDNQLYVAVCSPARDTSATYHAWGHSLVADPMARVLVELEDKEGIAVAELTGDKIAETRKGIPLGGQRRFDVYPDISKGKIRFDE